MDPLHLSIEADNAKGTSLRTSAREWMQAAEVRADTIEDGLLVLSELFSNAVTASRAGDVVEVRLTSGVHGQIQVSVTNTGLAFDLERVPAPTLDRRGGRGLAIAQAIGSLNVRHRDGRTMVAVDIVRS